MPREKPSEFVVLLLAPILIAAASLAVWSAHFQATFQGDDAHVIVKNRAIQDVANVPRFFSNPLFYADQPEMAQYRPLALTSLAMDAQLAQPLNPRVFDIDSFAWFLLEVVLFFGFSTLLFSGRWQAALFCTALFLFHPLTGETVNYASHRGDITGAIGLLAAMVFQLVWPYRLPARLIHFEGIPKNDWDDFRRRRGAEVNARYRQFVEAPLGFYLIPLIPGLLAAPDIWIYPLLLLAYILLLDRKPERAAPWKRVLPSAIVCFGFEAAQLAATWKYGTGYRMPALLYWITEPWVALRYLARFVVPIGLTPESDVSVFNSVADPRAVAGLAGLAVLVWAAWWLGRREPWRTAAFGLWWFLIALLPTALVPQRMAESDTRMYVPMLGLAIFATQALLNLRERLARGEGAGGRAVHAATAAALAILGVLAALTYQRNQVWSSELSFREDVAAKSPGSGAALVELALALKANGQAPEGYAKLLKGAELIAAAAKQRKDAPDEIRLARAFDIGNRDAEAEQHFRQAIGADAEYSSAWSAYSQWLIVHQRRKEAFDAADRALRLSPWNIEARHTLLQYYSADSDWPNLKKVASEILKFDPTDTDAQSAMNIVQASAEAVAKAEEKARKEPSVDDFLALSVRYYQARRFEDCIRACRQAIELRQDLAEAYSNMAAAQHALGRDDDAIEALRNAVRVRPDLAVARRNLEFLLGRKAEQAVTPAGK